MASIHQHCSGNDVLWQRLPAARANFRGGHSGGMESIFSELSQKPMTFQALVIPLYIFIQLLKSLIFVPKIHLKHKKAFWLRFDLFSLSALYHNRQLMIVKTASIIQEQDKGSSFCIGLQLHFLSLLHGNRSNVSWAHLSSILELCELDHLNLIQSHFPRVTHQAPAHWSRLQRGSLT